MVHIVSWETPRTTRTRMVQQLNTYEFHTSGSTVVHSQIIQHIAPQCWLHNASCGTVHGCHENTYCTIIETVYATTYLSQHAYEVSKGW
jgi:hypothetical protein